MQVKSLCDMTFSDLASELEAARQAVQAADYQDGLDAWQRAKDAANERLRMVQAEVDLRLSRLGAAGGTPVEG
jgi:hypothetical protein